MSIHELEEQVKKEAEDLVRAKAKLAKAKAKKKVRKDHSKEIKLLLEDKELHVGYYELGIKDKPNAAIFLLEILESNDLKLAKKLSKACDLFHKRIKLEELDKVKQENELLKRLKLTREEVKLLLSIR